MLRHILRQNWMWCTISECCALPLSSHWDTRGGRHRYMQYLLFIATGFMGNWGRQYINVLESKARAIASSQGHQDCPFPRGYRHVTHTHRQCHSDLFTLDLFLLLTNTWAVSGLKHVEACSTYAYTAQSEHWVSIKSYSLLLLLCISSVKCSALTNSQPLIHNSLQFSRGFILFICNSLTTTPLLKLKKVRKLLLRLKIKRRKLKTLCPSLYLWIFSVCIFSSGNLGSQLVEYKEEMYITSDCGKTWRQVKMNTEKTLMVCECVLQWLFGVRKMLHYSFFCDLSGLLRFALCI